MPFDHTGFVETDVALVLKAAKARISKPELWGKYHTSIGNRVCTIGAIMLVIGVDHVPSGMLGGSAEKQEAQRDLMRQAVKKLHLHIPGTYSGNVQTYNDAATTTHEDVMAWFDRAIESC